MVGRRRRRDPTKKISRDPNFSCHSGLASNSHFVLKSSDATARPTPHRRQTDRNGLLDPLPTGRGVAALVANPQTNQRPGGGIPPAHPGTDRQGRGGGPGRNLPTPGIPPETAPRERTETARQAAGNIRSGGRGGARTATDPGKAPKAQAPARPAGGGEANSRRTTGPATGRVGGSRGRARAAGAPTHQTAATPASAAGASLPHRRPTAAPVPSGRVPAKKSLIRAGEGARAKRYDIKTK